MNKQNFEQFIRKALNNVPVAMPDDAWFRFYMRNRNHLIENPIDNAVVTALSSLPLALNLKPDWTTFLANYESQALDDFIKDTLKESKDNSAAPDWDTFSSKLSVQEEAKLDEYVKDSLSSIHRETPATAWEKLYIYIEKRFRAAFYLWTSRILEFISMCLIIWTLLVFSDQFTKNNIEKVQDTFDDSIEYADTRDADTEVESSYNISEVSDNSVPGQYIEDSDQQILSNATSDLINSSSTFYSRPTSIRNIYSAYEDDNTSLLLKDRQVGNNQLLSLTSIQHTDIVDKYMADYKYTEAMGNSDYTESEEAHILINPEIAIKDLLHPLDIEEEISYSKDPVNFAIKTGEEEFDRRYISVYFNQRIDIINTPFNARHNIGPFRSFQPGHGFGVDYSFDAAKNLIFGTGFAFNLYKYNPPAISETYGSMVSGMERISMGEISLKELRIPFQLKYIGYNYNRFNFFGTAGLNIHMLADSRFEIMKSILSNSLMDFSIAPNAIAGERANKSQSFYATILDPDYSVNADMYASAFVGVGTEFIVTRYMYLFFHAQYDKFIGQYGLEPNGNTFDGLNFKFGVEFIL